MSMFEKPININYTLDIYWFFILIFYLDLTADD
ncbi:hypothetical protein EDF67_10373 [Sphingobacterium sp. JUb78]|nr:hypothetical protein [Sphingobacterium kitahiroshimense]TCR11660.1 hypothetical protein EDF67_10373 [Sphingobacterium sp. JUb78]